MATSTKKTTSGVDIFANEFYFPAFHDLGHEHDINLDRWYERSPGCLSRACTWCFLGEITNDECSQIPGAMFRNRVFVKDRSGREIRILFYPETGHFDFTTLRNGHTICVMLAEQHYFMDMTVGLRIEALDLVKVIPCSLNDLLELSSTYSKCCDPSVCWHCGRRSDHELKKCAACRVARYCDRECQTGDWKSRHRRWCKAMPEFIKMARIDYSQFDSEALIGDHGPIW